MTNKRLYIRTKKPTPPVPADDKITSLSRESYKVKDMQEIRPAIVEDYKKNKAKVQRAPPVWSEGDSSSQVRHIMAELPPPGPKELRAASAEHVTIPALMPLTPDLELKRWESHRLQKSVFLYPKREPTDRNHDLISGRQVTPPTPRQTNRYISADRIQKTDELSNKNRFNIITNQPLYPA